MAGRPLDTLPPHGTRARYQHRRDGCKCAACSAANARYQAAYRAAYAPPGHGEQLTLPDHEHLRIRVGR